MDRHRIRPRRHGMIDSAFLLGYNPFHDARRLAERLARPGLGRGGGMVASAGLLLGGVLATDPRAIVAWFSLALGASRQTQQHNYARPLDITCVGDPGKTLGD